MTIVMNMTRERMGALALPKPVYRCQQCGIEYEHDEARHHYFECVARSTIEGGMSGR
jgi:hypothetical protein